MQKLLQNLGLKAIRPYIYTEYLQNCYNTHTHNTFIVDWIKRIKNAEYEHTKNVWNNFKIKYIERYARLYNETDVIILAGIF